MKLTDRFKKAVKAYVADGVLTDEEKDILRKIAKEEDINEIDAETYFTGELKKIKVKIQNPKPPKSPIKWDGIAAVGTALLAVGKFAYDVLKELDKLPKPKKM